ncbi:bifunctional diguanylate cyclase/phosphodiesterase [Cytobacillus gottheilii]|uniref:bifunctional diguanylate cyclase/phosphodiesterase n=1 Tax=Cytobacillus gottheilii TaxID=859144 RepID=UPI0024940F1C|nr:EAL domain-containing protein [Cytobacillus gottheilii]
MAKTYSCMYTNDDQLYSFIEDHELTTYSNVLVQVFSGTTDKEKLEQLLAALRMYIPLGIVTGCTASGEIFQGKLSENNIILTFTIFEDTKIKSIYIDTNQNNNSIEIGRALSELAEEKTKALILFFAGYELNVQSVLEVLHEDHPEIILAGGMAGCLKTADDSLVFNQNRIISNGVTAVALQGEYLNAHSYVNYQLKEIGRPFTVTKADGTSIYEIDGKDPLLLIKNYLGEHNASHLSKASMEFPFLHEYKGEKLPVFITSIQKDGSIKVSRPVKEGDLLSFAYTNIQNMIHHTSDWMEKLSQQNPQSIFVYNCIAKKNYSQDFAEIELAMLQSIAPSNGVFLHGEIGYTNGRQPKMLGHSFSCLALSEGSIKMAEKKSFDYEIPHYIKTIDSLTHLMRASLKDIEELNNSLSLSEQHYRSLFDHNADIVYSTDLNGVFTSVNTAFEKTFEYSKDEVIGTSALNYIDSADIPRIRIHYARALKGQHQHYNIELTTKTGENNLYQIKNIPVIVNGQTVGVYGIGKNITELKKIEEKVTELSYFDTLTGLPNRVKFIEQLEEFTRKAENQNRMLAVLSVDIDRFKFINDGFGHDAGDLILKELSERIEKVLTAGTYLSSFGGDKFTLVFSRTKDMEDVMKKAKYILQEIAKPAYYKGKEFFLTASIGVSLYPDDGEDQNSLIKNADIAMNRSKKQGGNRITFFSMEMDSQAMARLELESYLRKALQKNEFHLCYQPLINLETGNVYGSEALIRWNHPILGVVSPADFIPLAEETGLIEEIGAWVLRTACVQNKQWQRLGLGMLSISVNVSANQFQQPNFVEQVKQALLDSELEAKYLTLELTESTMLNDVDYSIQVMKSLQELGVKVSIDDFGTGYSSLSYLRNLPINTLKIDRSFINNLKLDTSDVAIVKAIITMGQGLDVQVVAEGVETEEQIELLKEMKCHFAQGFFYHKPLKSADFEKDIKGVSI